VTVACKTCGADFEPQPRGYNARYCSDRCKRANQRARLRLLFPEKPKAARRREYAATKADAARLERHRAAGRKSVTKVRLWLAAYKLERGCADCSYREHPAALQLDHEGPKAVEISDARSSISRLKAEIESGRCVVRCANCHSIRTWKQKQRKEKI
jgi:endogenous inhibitor of DNA gyrase (YacG/DUF329 family)